MRLFGWFRKEPETEPQKVKVLDIQGIRQIDIYTKEGVFPEKIYTNKWNCGTGLWFSNGFMQIHNTDEEIVAHKQDEVLRYIAKTIQETTYKYIIAHK